MSPIFGNLRDTPDRGAALASYARLAPDYDASCGWLGRLRFEALELLAAREGETVIDVACGTGAMLPALAGAVGRSGRVIGIEQCPEMAALARERASRAGLDNIRIVVAPVEEAEVEEKADALLFFYTHDVLQSERAVGRMLACARPGARVVAAGARLLGWWAAPVNLWKLWRARHYLSTYRGLRDPTAQLAPHCGDWQIAATQALGASYLARGTLLPPGS